MTTQANDINGRQNDTESLDLLKAADAAHMYARWAESVRFGISAATAVAAMVASTRPDLGVLTAVLAGAGVVASELVRILGTLRWTRKGMLLQEWFDTTLFGMNWESAVGKKPLHEDSRYWKKRFRGDPRQKENWYIDVRGLPLGHAVLLCQRQNLAWDARLRSNWGAVLIAVAILWVTLGLVVGVAWEWKVSELLLRWMLPSAPALVYAVSSGHRHRQMAAEKDDLIRRVEDHLGAVTVQSPTGQKRLLSVARKVQTDLARLRAEEMRVPNWFYMWQRGSYEDEAESAAERWRNKLLSDAKAAHGTQPAGSGP